MLNDGGAIMSIEEIKKEFLEIKTKGQTEGLIFDDYLKLKKMRDSLGLSIENSDIPHDYLNNDFFPLIEEFYSKGMRGILSYTDYIAFKEEMDKLDLGIISYFSYDVERENSGNLFVDIDNTIQEIYLKGMLNRFSSNDCRYIIQNSFLLPLVLANNTHHRIRLTGDNRYMFLCQLHWEKTPSLGVYDLNNTFRCFGCGYGGNSVYYLQKYEDLSFTEALQLLAQIYLFDINNKNPKLEGLVQKYQATILSDEYQHLLELGRERLKGRNIEIINGVRVDDLYNKRYDAINRIKAQEFDSNFKYEGPKKLIYLNK